MRRSQCTDRFGLNGLSRVRRERLLAQTGFGKPLVCRKEQLDAPAAVRSPTRTREEPFFELCGTNRFQAVMANPASSRTSHDAVASPGTHDTAQARKKAEPMPREVSGLKRILRDNGLSIVMLGLFFLAFLMGQTITGHLEHNSEQREHGRAEITLSDYLTTPHFVEATMENWESEFLQMFLFVALTAVLFQRGSAESKDPDKEDASDRDPRASGHKKDAPWPVRRGGAVLWIYERSLSLAFLVLFLIAFVLHAAGGARLYNEEQLDHGVREQLSTWEYLGTSRFWFESLQNWQSEFLAVGAMVVLSIWLRQRGSPESKPVDAPHAQTGKD